MVVKAENYTVFKLVIILQQHPTYLTISHSNDSTRKQKTTSQSNKLNSAYKLPLIYCSVHYKPRYGKWKEVIFPARNLKVC